MMYGIANRANCIGKDIGQFSVLVVWSKYIVETNKEV